MSRVAFKRRVLLLVLPEQKARADLLSADLRKRGLEARKNSLRA